MAGKSVEQRLAEMEMRIKQMEARKQTLSQQLKEQEHRERTRRLIQIGAIMVRLGVDTLEKAQALQHEVEAHPEVRAWLTAVLSLLPVGGAAPS